MPQKGLVRFAVLGAVLVSVLALCIGVAAWELRPSASSAPEYECTDNDYRLAEQLARDPILTSRAPRTTIGSIYQQPCGDGSLPSATMQVDIGLPPGPMYPVIDHYRALLAAGHWRIVRVPGTAPVPENGELLCAERVTNGKRVFLSISNGFYTPGPDSDGEIKLYIEWSLGREEAQC
ncbi:hypothetical protein OG799_03880 [Micromonospora sp. NBC_00898]|uniref:hypothetical protein n=1 Tax=Micromonospora sp. NBC_00898 TaxID=2975981 RepID=UPI003869DC10|nr:hypothetical protein OG799_03880 [Micromonospora sp. NBC_00898]